VIFAVNLNVGSNSLKTQSLHLTDLYSNVVRLYGWISLRNWSRGGRLWLAKPAF